jgi:LysR family transcriptional regulator of beta-lactamase
MQGMGVALAPPMMFARDLQQGRLVRPFQTQVSAGRYWLTWLKSKAPSPALRAFQAWLSRTSEE